MSDLMNHVIKSFPEEIEGVLHYSQMAKMAESEGDHGKAAILRDMAEEEFCHAKHLKMMIHKGASGNPPANHAEMMKKFKEAKAAIEDI